jgi:hypothetical protein
MHKTNKTHHKRKEIKMNPVEEFITECIEEGSQDDYLKAIDLYMMYLKWATTNKKFKCTNTRFGIEMTRYFKKLKKREGYFYTECKLKKPIKYFEGETKMSAEEKEEIIVRLNDVYMKLGYRAATDETAAEVRDLINTIIQLLIK